jgi:hypothetical protein
MEETAYFGWMRVIAAAHTAVELAVLERGLQRFPASAEREQLADLCTVRRVDLEPATGRTCVPVGPAG